MGINRNSNRRMITEWIVEIGQNLRLGGPQILGDVLVLFIMYYMTIDFEYVYVIVYTNVYVYIYIYMFSIHHPRKKWGTQF
jgi:hypothetical protein